VANRLPRDEPRNAHRLDINRLSDHLCFLSGLRWGISELNSMPLQDFQIRHMVWTWRQGLFWVLPLT
jgi:hypothetical protein